MLKVTCALIIHNSKILITQNNAASDHPFQWEFPGGKIESGESAEDCIKREIAEELKLDIKILKPMEAVEFAYGLKKIHLIPFLCSVKSGEIKLVEHIKFAWISLTEFGSYRLSEADEKLVHHNKNWDILMECVRE